MASWHLAVYCCFALSHTRTRPSLARMKAFCHSEPFLHPINARDIEGNTALHVASLNGQKDMVESLLGSTTFKCVCLQNNTGRTALHCAAAQGHDEVTRLLLESCRFTDEAVDALAEEELEYMSAASTLYTIVEDDCTALHLAAKFGHIAVAGVLLESGRFGGSDAAILTKNATALHVAARYGHLGVVEVLLNSTRFNAVNALDIHGKSALHGAAVYGHGAVARALLRSLRFTMAPQQSFIWADSMTALHDAAWQGHAEVARVLLSESRFLTATINAVNRYGGTALHVAARHGHDVVARALLAFGRFQGADLSGLLREYRSPLGSRCWSSPGCKRAC